MDNDMPKWAQRPEELQGPLDKLRRYPQTPDEAYPDEPIEMVPSYTLNVEQQVAFDWLTGFCTGFYPEWRKVLLQGYAGTGKTFTLTKMIERVRKSWPEINFGITAPTHKAVRVIKNQSEFKDQLDFGTIHSFLGLKQKVNELTGEVTYEREFSSTNGPRRIDGINVLIVDESSMLDDKLFEYIETEQRSNSKLKVIYTGDALQIPPVGKKQKVLNEINAIPFIEVRRRAHKIHLLELIQPQRQSADSPIIMYAHAIREQYQKQYVEFEIIPEYSEALEVVPSKGNREGMERLFTQYFKTQEFEDDPDYCKVIAWRNATVDYINAMVREIIFEKKDLPKILIGDKLVMEEPWTKNDRIVLPKNEDVELKSADVIDIEFRYKLITKSTFTNSDVIDPFADLEKHTKTTSLKVYKVTLVDNDGDSYQGRVIHEDSEKKFIEIQESIKQAALSLSGYDRSAMWREFYSISSKFMWVRHNYCLTAHKSQGSTYQYGISMEWDMNVNRDIEERNRIKYVAATRAKHKLFVIR